MFHVQHSEKEADGLGCFTCNTALEAGLTAACRWAQIPAMGFESQIKEALSELEASGLLRTPLRISGPQGPEVLIDGKPVLCFCSNNYLGLANHPAIVAAAEASLRIDGVGASASRLITGTMDAHREAESAFAEFLGAPSAALFSTGYAANLGTIQALVGPGDLVFSDALNHASLIDGCRLSRAPSMSTHTGAPATSSPSSNDIEPRAGARSWSPTRSFRRTV